MIQVRRGRGGWSSSLSLIRAAAIAVLALTVTAFGCSSQQAPQGAGGPGGRGGAGMGEQGIGGTQNSLTRFQKGTLGREESGPLTDIHFGFNDYTIQPQDGAILRTNAQWLSQHANTRVQVEGHCDERGSEEYNIALGAKRAQAAKDYLETLGIAGSRISTISYGKELPLCTEHTESCWAENRRDHFVVTQ